MFKEVNINLTYPENELDLVFVELAKFTKGQEELETLADKWIYFMKNARSLTSIPETMDSIPEIHKAFNIANQASLSREEVEDLDRREQFIYDQQGAIIKAVQDGIEQGIEQGREQGMRFKAIAIARQLLSGLDDETISQTTGLSVENVRNLRSNEI